MDGPKLKNSNHNPMFKSYLKTTLRTIRRSPLSSFINIFGLAMALGVAILVYAFVDMDLTTDQFHKNRSEIYMATADLNRNGQEAEYGITPAPYADKLMNDFPQIKRVVRVESRSGVLKAGLRVFNEYFTFADPAYLDMFTFPLKSGDKSALNDPNKIILSEATAIKYFGDEDPMGKAMTFDFGATKYTFEVAGVAEKFPAKRSMDFRVLVNFDQLKLIDPSFQLSDWSRFLDATFIQVENPDDIATITASVQQYVPVQNEVQQDWPVATFGFKPWTRLYVEGEDMRSTITGNADSLGRLVLTVIGIFVLILAVFNYINIAIVSATKRLKEIGVRKVMGGTRKSLVLQFLSENVILTLGALILGFILAVTVLIPGFDKLFDIGMEFDISQPQLWVFLMALVVLTGLASGAYPALYISNFNAVNIFRGRLKFGGKNNLTKVFLTFQYILAVIAVVGGILFTQNTAYQKSRDWGYDQGATMSAYLEDGTEVKQLMAAMERNPNVVNLAASKHHIGRSQARKIIKTLDDRSLDLATFEIGPDYIETMGLELVAGRSFDKAREADFRNVLVNETLGKILNPNRVLGTTFRIDSLTYTVVGVVRDFHDESFFEPIEPMLIQLTEESNYTYLSLQVAQGKLKETYEQLEAEWAGLFPEKPFTGFYQESTLQWYFYQVEGHGKLMQYVATLCIILSCLGLYGLVSLNVASRVKEFSIRKALGATLKNLVLVINRQFVVFLAIALALGIPLSFLLMQSLFDAVYAYYKPLSVLPFAFALFLVVLMVFITVSSQVKKVMNTSPTEGLRSE
jgi:ABC-type antimicrobial peptide transport system permease subunit